MTDLTKTREGQQSIKMWNHDDNHRCFLQDYIHQTISKCQCNQSSRCLLDWFSWLDLLVNNTNLSLGIQKHSWPWLQLNIVKNTFTAGCNKLARGSWKTWRFATATSCWKNKVSFVSISDLPSSCASVKVCSWASKKSEQMDEKISSWKSISAHETYEEESEWKSWMFCSSMVWMCCRSFVYDMTAGFHVPYYILQS